MSVDVAGMVVLSGTKSWVSRAIMWWTKSKFSHAAVLLGTMYDYIFKFEAQSKGVIPYLFKPKKKDFCEIWRVKASDGKIEESMKVIFGLCGKRYWYENLAGFMISKTANWFGLKKVKNPFHGGYWCSKLAEYYVNLITEREWIDPDNTTPEDMSVLFRANPDIFTLVAKSEYKKEGIEWL